MPKFEVPQHIAEELHQLGGDHSSRQWRIGQLVAEVMDYYCASKDPMFPRVTVRGALADEMGQGQDAVYVYERAWRMYPVNLRSTVDPQEVLSFEHWRAILPLGVRGVDYLQKALDSAHDYGGRPAPVRVVQAWVLKHGGKAPKDRWRRVLELLEAIAADQHEKPRRRVLARKWREDGLAL